MMFLMATDKYNCSENICSTELSRQHIGQCKSDQIDSHKIYKHKFNGKPERSQEILGGIVLGYIWQLIINGVLAFFKTTLTVKASYGFWGMVIAMNWQMIGYMMVIYIAAIQNISEDVKEAALIDGVNRRQMVTKIILPLIMPAITICLFMTTTNAFKMFDLNLALTAGLPGKSTSLVALDIYNSFYNRMGYEGIGQAKAVLFLLIVAAISVTQLVVTRRKEVES